MIMYLVCLLYTSDTALGKRIDKEIQDRTDADTALDNKFTNITDDHEERLLTATSSKRYCCQRKYSD